MAGLSQWTDPGKAGQKGPTFALTDCGSGPGTNNMAQPGLTKRLALAYLPLLAVWAVYHALALTVLDQVTTPINYDILKFLPGFLPALPFFGIGVIFFLYFRLFVFRAGIAPVRWSSTT